MEFDFDNGFKKNERRQPMWLTSFADLMSLLFAMFVMLLSFSDINSDSFHKNAGPIADAFDSQAPRTSIVPPPQVLPQMKLDLLQRDREEEEEPEVEREEPPPPTRALAAELRKVVAVELRDQMVDVIERDNMVVIRFRDHAAFAAGQRELTSAILPTLDNIAGVLGHRAGRIRIEGHTDNVPINTEMFRSNWDLSAARAASVVHYLLQTGAISADRISAEGFADSRPLGDNVTAEDRARNRRVEISIEVPATVQPAQPMPEKAR